MISFAIERRANDALAELPDDQADRVFTAAQKDRRYRVEFWSLGLAVPALIFATVLASWSLVKSFPIGSPWRAAIAIALLGVGYLIARLAYPLNRARLSASILRVLRGTAP